MLLNTYPKYYKMCFMWIFKDYKVQMHFKSVAVNSKPSLLPLGATHLRIAMGKGKGKGKGKDKKGGKGRGRGAANKRGREPARFHPEKIDVLTLTNNSALKHVISPTICLVQLKISWGFHQH